MECSLSRCLTLSTQARSQREAEQDCKEPIKRLKAFAVAFDFELTYTTSIQRGDSFDLNGNFYFLKYQLYLETEVGRILTLSAMIVNFANMNGFKMGEEEVYFVKDEV